MSNLTISGLSDMAAKYPDGKWRELRIQFRHRAGVAEVLVDRDIRDVEPDIYNEAGFMVRSPLTIADSQDKLLIMNWPRDQRVVSK